MPDGGLGRSAIVVAMALLVATVVFPAAQIVVELPPPLTGPGPPEPARAEQKRISKAWRQLERGRTDRAADAAERAGDGAAARLLRLQVQLLAGGDPTAALQQLVDHEPGYAAAWFTLSVAAEKAGQTSVAYDAAQRAASLWPSSPWSARRARLRQLWVEAPLAEARRLIADGSAERALQDLQPVLALEPKAPDVVVTRARALIQLERLQDAEEALAALPDDPEAVMLAGEVAERQGHWFEAMERYNSVPEDTPGRDQALHRARLRWRLSTLPRYASQALVSPAITRAELAVLLVDLAPAVEAIPGGPVPLLSDIVDTPGQREIVTAVRLHLLDVDELEHRFDPSRPASPEEVRSAVDSLGRLLGAEPPRWCGPSSVVSSPCTELGEPVNGETVAGLILAMAHGEGP